MVNTFYQYAREHLSNSRERAFAAVALASRELYKGCSETKRQERYTRDFLRKEGKILSGGERLKSDRGFERLKSGCVSS